MTRALALLLPITLILGCQVKDGDSTPSSGSKPASRSGSRPTSGSRPFGANGRRAPAVDMTAINEATAAAKKAAKEAREVTREARKSLADLNKRLDELLRLTKTGSVGKELKNVVKDAVKNLKDNANNVNKVINFDHSAFDTLLKKYVKDGFVNYKDWKNNDLKALDVYLDRVRNCKPALLANDKHRMVFWINVYNAWTIRSMIKFYPTTSIRNHEKGKSSDGFGIWKNNPITIAGKDYHLDGIENKTLRPMGDARIHFAIVCASIGCPPLRSTAYTVKNLSAEMDANGRAFFASEGKFKADVAAKKVYLSKIFSWFDKDFGKNKNDILKYLAQFVTDPEIKKLMESGTATVEYLWYDWNINEQK
jgi:hypothetical protein